MFFSLQDENVSARVRYSNKKCSHFLVDSHIPTCMLGVFPAKNNVDQISMTESKLIFICVHSGFATKVITVRDVIFHFVHDGLYFNYSMYFGTYW